MASVAFIGLGNMGGPMAKNLLKAGHTVTVFDLVAEACADLQQAGATVATSTEEAASGVDYLVSMLPAGKHVAGIYLGEDGLLSKLGASTPANRSKVASSRPSAPRNQPSKNACNSSTSTRHRSSTRLS